MSKTILIKEVQIVNEGKITTADIFIKNGRIEKIAGSIDKNATIEIAGSGKHCIPGIIDDQVHFREPGLTHKSDLYTEPRAAVAGGTTSFMEMPNTIPNTLTQALLEDKYQIGASKSLANYSFFMGASNDNLEEVLKTNGKNVCGVKIFMGSSTGNMLVDNEKTLDNLFRNVPLLIATHCEDEATIRANNAAFKEKYGENAHARQHPIIRNVEGCYKSSSFAVDLAKKHNTRLHILHISTKKELDLFRNDIPLEEKRITAEVCVHHLHFNSKDYEKLGNLIKCNPAIKERKHQAALLPHTWEEKSQEYFKAPGGVPTVQHSLNMMLGFYHKGKISLERIVEKMCHAPAICFKVEDRGYIREGYWADLAIVDVHKKWKVMKKNIHYKCGWSPFENKFLKGKVSHTIVSGHLAYQDGQFFEDKKGERLTFKH